MNIFTLTHEDYFCIRTDNTQVLRSCNDKELKRDKSFKKYFNSEQLNKVI